MNWVTIIWSMIASACLTLAAVHFLVWCQRRTVWDGLMFSLTSAAVAVYAGFELRMMQAETPAQFATALRWLHVPTWVIVVSLVGFVRFHLRAGRPWLAWSICGLRTLALLINFLMGQNLNYREVTALRRMPFLGQSVSTGVGVSNPYMLVGQLSLLLLLIFTADATIIVWRRGDRRKALTTGGSIVFFAAAGIAQSLLVLWQLVPMPLTASFCYLGIVAAMGYEMSREMIRAAQIGREFQESEQRLALAVDAANLGIWTRDLVRNQIWASEHWRSLFGFAKSEPLALDQIVQRVHPDDREATSQTLAKAVAHGGGYKTEYRIVLPDGAIRWIASRGRVESNGEHKPTLIRGVSLDITERKRSEIEKQELRQELAHAGRVTMLGQLASSLAHELGQPLGAILRNAETAELLLQSASPDLDELRAIVTDIQKDDQRAGDVIDRLRLLLKRRTLELQNIDLDKLVDEVVALVGFDAAARSVKLAVKVPPGLPPVQGDRVHLQQVLLNLIINGMDAVNTEPEDRRCVNLHARLSQQGMLEVAVSDSGHGVPSETLGKLFEPFFTTKPNGMGMGLPISRTIVEAHGGSIWAENNPDYGTTVRFTLCAAEAGDDA